MIQTFTFSKIASAFGIRGVLIGVIGFAGVVLFFMNNVLEAKLSRANVEIATLQNEATDLKGQIGALKEAARLDERAATASYNAIQQSCDRRIQAAIDALEAPIVNPTPEVPPNAPTGTAAVCDCPSRRLRDVAAPFNAP